MSEYAPLTPAELEEIFEVNATRLEGDLRRLEAFVRSLEPGGRRDYLAELGADVRLHGSGVCVTALVNMRGLFPPEGTVLH